MSEPSRDRPAAPGGAEAKAEAVAAYRLEEFRALRREIEYLDQRIERAQFTMMLANAITLTAIYVPTEIKSGAAEIAIDEATIAAFGPTVAIGLFCLNLTVGVKYIGQGLHVDTIGAYLARLEASIYGDAHPGLGWERMMRTPGELTVPGKTVKRRTGERLRRYGVWLFLWIVSAVVVFEKALPYMFAKGAI